MRMWLITGIMRGEFLGGTDNQIVNDIGFFETADQAMGWALGVEQEKWPRHAAQCFKAHDITTQARLFVTQHPERRPDPPPPPPPTRPLPPLSA